MAAHAAFGWRLSPAACGCGLPGPLLHSFSLQSLEDGVSLLPAPTCLPLPSTARRSAQCLCCPLGCHHSRRFPPTVLSTRPAEKNVVGEVKTEVFVLKVSTPGTLQEEGDLDYAAVALLAVVCSLLECLVGKDGLMNDFIPSFALRDGLQVRCVAFFLRGCPPCCHCTGLEHRHAWHAALRCKGAVLSACTRSNGWVLWRVCCRLWPSTPLPPNHPCRAVPDLLPARPAAALLGDCGAALGQGAVSVASACSSARSWPTNRPPLAAPLPCCMTHPRSPSSHACLDLPVNVSFSAG